MNIEIKFNNLWKFCKRKINCYKFKNYKKKKMTRNGENN